MRVCKCNLCGKEFNCWDEQEGLNIHTRLGYGSKYDGSLVNLDICIDCFDTIIEQSSINPIVKEARIYEQLEF